jgi:hypothetical protein
MTGSRKHRKIGVDGRYTRREVAIECWPAGTNFTAPPLFATR